MNLQVESIVALGRIGSDRAVAGLVHLLASPKVRCGDAAAWALSRIQSSRSAKALLLRARRSARIGADDACAGLGLQGGPELRPVLEEVMLDPQRDERVRAAVRLGPRRDRCGRRGPRSDRPRWISGDEQLQRCARGRWA